MHVTLTSIKSSKPFKDKLKDFQLPEDIKFPNVELGNAGFVYREDGKTTYVAAVKNQNDIKEFVDKIYQKIGETNPEPNRFFHITLANNQGGDPFKSIGNVEKSDLIKENKSSSLHFFFDLDGSYPSSSSSSPKFLDASQNSLEPKRNGGRFSALYQNI
jgi:hypothetical protein